MNFATQRAQAIRGLRLLFGLLFLTTSTGKLLDNRGFSEVLGTYQLLPSPLLLPLALSISLAEFYLGLLLVLGRRLGRAVMATAFINVGYLCLALLTLYRGIHLVNCGCFGVYLARSLTWMTVVEDSVIAGLSLLFVWLTKGELNETLT